jgi:hypothetical protein
MEFLDTIRKEGTLKKSPIIAAGLARDYADIWGWAQAEVSTSKPKYVRNRAGEVCTPGCFIRTMGYKVSWYKFRTKEDAQAFSLASRTLISGEDRHRLSSPITTFTIDIGILEAISLLVKHDSKFTHTKEAFDSLYGHIAGLKFSL